MSTAPGPRAIGWLRSQRARSVGAVVLVLALVAVVVPGLYRSSGPPMEEGFMLTFPQRILAGDVANEDFLHLYGPGSLWVLAGAFEVFGDTLWTERTLGLIQKLGVIVGVFAIARPWGRWVAVLAAGLTSVVLLPVGLTAMAWNGAVALGLWALWLALAARRRADDGAARPRLLAAGLLGGLALTYRPDLVVALGAALGVAAWGERRRLRPLAIGAAAGVSPFLVQVALAGPVTALRGMVIEPVFQLRPGRSLPVPPSWSEIDGFLQRAAAVRSPGWDLPAPATSNQIFLWFFVLLAAALFVLGVGWWAVRTDRASWRARVLVAAGVLSVGIVPQAIQRPDTTHLAWVSCVAVALVPVAIAQLLAPHPARVRVLAGAGFAGVLVLGVIPFFTVRDYADLTAQTFGDDPAGSEIRREDRVFYYGNGPPARAAQALVADLDGLAEPGDSLFVGPTDLRQTPYSEAFFYYLFPDLEPATRYIEMDPGIANAADSGLAEDVASADWLILSDVWSDWEERNESRELGPAEPNRVVASRFCEVGAYPEPATGNAGTPLYLLYRACDPGRR